MPLPRARRLLLFIALIGDLAPQVARAQQSQETVSSPATVTVETAPPAPPAPHALPVAHPPPPPPVGPATGAPLAPPGPARFGRRREWVITGASELSAGGHVYTGSAASGGSFVFSPGVDYFVADHVSLGATLDFRYSNAKSYDSAAGSALVAREALTFGIGPRFGVDVPLGNLVSVYPRLTATYGHTYTHYRIESGAVAVGAGAGSEERNSVALLLYVPFLLHVAPHFFVGFGPYVRQELMNQRVSDGHDIQETSFGGSLVVGGWFK